jgi:hypothetical protein
VTAALPEVWTRRVERWREWATLHRVDAAERLLAPIVATLPVDRAARARWALKSLRDAIRGEGA